MKKEIFKVGDKVYHIEYGWGVVTKICSISSDSFVEFFIDRDLWFDYSCELLSFTEYTLQGVSQERPIVLPEKGELCLIRDNESQDWQVRKFLYYKETCNIFVCLNIFEDTEMKWKQMKRIKILD